MLSFIAELTDGDFQRAKAQEGEITSAVLYRLLIERWLNFEFKRAHPQGAVPGLTKEDRWQAITEIALHLWQKPDRAVHMTELTERVGEIAGKLSQLHDAPLTAAHQVGSGTLLVRDEEGNFTFIHQSVLEWLVAHQAAQYLEDDAAVQVLAVREISPLMADFLVGLAGKEKAKAWARSVLVQDEAGETSRKNALLVWTRLGEATITALALNFAGQDLSGKDFSGQNLAYADFTNANLTQARFIESNLSHAMLRGAILRDADLSRANLSARHPARLTAPAPASSARTLPMRNCKILASISPN